MSDQELSVDLPDEAATIAFAEDVAARLQSGDVIALKGDLGAGKTTFARALIRAIASDPALEVPSPTFTLVQTYGQGRVAVAHFDLYRVSRPEEIDEIGLEESLNEGAVLIEWPERAGGRLPSERVEIAFVIEGQGRRATVTGNGAMLERFTRSRAARALLDDAGFGQATRRHLQGDASTRLYERIAAGDRRAILMDWPPKAGPDTRDRRASFRARDARAFIAVDEALRGLGLSAPSILAADTRTGFLLLEDLGSEGVIAGGAPIAERYAAAIEVLAAIHAGRRTHALPFPGGMHVLPDYAAEAIAAEVDLFADWYVPHITGRALPVTGVLEFRRIWADLAERLANAERSWVLLDFHSPNLLWLGDRKGLARVGLLDFQDMLIGPAAYDVASLCQDARVTVPQALETALKEHYVAIRTAADAGFDRAAFAEAYAILAAQRATKILGIFARLADHAGRRDYLKHLPRLGEYLSRSLAHEALTGYAQWYRTYLPG